MKNYEMLQYKKQKKYIKKLKKENELLQLKLNGSNATVAKQIDYIAILNKQLEQQDLYINRYMGDIKVLKRMYRDDLINSFKYE